MKQAHWQSTFLGLMLIPLAAFCQAPVVDDSENFALLEHDASASARPIANAPIIYGDDERPLAQDNVSQTVKGQDNAMLLDKVQGLQQEIQELRGQLEVQNHELKALKEQQLAFYKDLDERIRATSNKPAAPAASAPEETNQKTDAIDPNEEINPSPPPAAPLSANPADEQVSYLAAYDLIKNKHFDEGLNAMQNFVNKYPHGGYAANAEYWIGELYLTKNAPKEAINHFEIVLKNFPRSSKAAASQLKLGYAYAANGQIPEARKQLEAVLKNYPDTQTAKLAANKLATLPRK